ncbi:hypothetical protein [Tunturiibacter lichenicola]|uniref:hypothetical protein n=1 Tax=Tunturiibacter lichenicola TaxID=2051959 RepID=UPI003D9AD77A
MRESPLLLGSVVAITLLLYLLAYFLLPPPPPSAAMVLLFAGIAVFFVWASRWGYKKYRSKKPPTIALCVLLIVLLPRPEVAALFQEPNFEKNTSLCKFMDGPRAGRVLSGWAAGLPAGTPCIDNFGSSGVIVVPGNSSLWSGPPPINNQEGIAPPQPASPVRPFPPAYSGESSIGNNSSPRRVTGMAPLVRQYAEEDGFGLYSYALLSHRPQATEVARYRAFITALIALPSKDDLKKLAAQRNQINVTYIPITSLNQGWDDMPTTDQVDWILSHYDYARSSLMLATIKGVRVGVGPIIISVLTPLKLDRAASTVIVQDLSTAQPTLVADYVAKFAVQAAEERSWKQEALADFSLGLRNILETAAIGLGMSQQAIKGWINFIH